MNTLNEYMRRAWTIERQDYVDDGEYLALTVAELPGFLVAGRSEEEVETEFWPALEAFLRSYLDAGEEPPVVVDSIQGDLISSQPEIPTTRDLVWEAGHPRFQSAQLGTHSRTQVIQSALGELGGIG